MKEIATVKNLYLYPVKSMRGVSVNEAHLGLNGFYGDRRYAFVRQELAASDGFPWMTGRDKPRMILYEPRFERAPTPTDDSPPLIVRAPNGEDFSIQDPRLCEQLTREFGHALFLLKNARGNFDSQHLSLFSLATRDYLARETESQIDARQFRANIYLEPLEGFPFVEEEWVGRVLRIGEALVGVTKKDTRCMMINLNPDSAMQSPQVLRTVTLKHNQQVGIYANVIAPGVIRTGDVIELM